MTKHMMMSAAIGALMVSGALAQSPNSSTSSSTPAATEHRHAGPAKLGQGGFRDVAETRSVAGIQVQRHQRNELG